MRPSVKSKTLRLLPVRPQAASFAVFALGIFCLWTALMTPAISAAKTQAGKDDLTELSLEALMEIEVPTVFGASKFEQKATEAPSSITVVTSEDIKRYGYRTLAAVVSS